MNNKKADELISLFVKVMNHYISTEKRPCDYGVGCLLYRSEIHTIDAVGSNSGINITGLSNRLGITKSAASQMIDKLIAKGLVIKTVLSKSDTEVALTLTKNGSKVYMAHLEYHKELYDYIRQMLSETPESNTEAFTEIMKRLDSYLDEVG